VPSLRKLSAVFFGVGWVLVAYYLWPENTVDQQVGSITVREGLRILASIVAVGVGVFIAARAWRG
jgi:hypothetical protein